jgi:hypothetical protein
MKKDFQSLVEGKIAEKGPGFKSWFECLNEPQQAELIKIRNRFREGGYGSTSKSALARAIMAAAKDQGWKTSGMQGVLAWLTK